MVSRRSVIVTGLVTLAGAAALYSRHGIVQPSGTQPGCLQLAGKTIRWIVPNAAGGGFDAESRLIEMLLEEQTGAQIVVENIPGAGGIVGARAIMTADPDGLTVGIVSAPGLLVAALAGAAEAPNPGRDFSILGRVSRSWFVWAVARNSPLQTIDDALAVARKRPVTFAINEIGSANVLAITASACLLGMDTALVAGYSGTRNVALAAIRGEVDLVCLNFETITDLVDSGDLRPLLQVSSRPISSHPSLDRVELLGGDAGCALRRARALGLDQARTIADATTLIDVLGAGRIIVAPLGLEAQLARCLGEGLHSTLTSTAFRTGANEALDVAGPEAARADIEHAASVAASLLPFIRDAIQKIR